MDKISQSLFDVAENGLQTDLGDFTSQPRTIKRTVYADPGHAWLKVPTHELYQLGIATKISRYSYRRGNTAYLEEDCDLGRYVEAWRARGVTVEFEEVHQDPTPIRNYRPYR